MHNNTKEIPAILIKSNDTSHGKSTMRLVTLYIDEKLGNELIELNTKFYSLCCNMNFFCDCKFFKRECINACYPENSAYSVFYQSRHETPTTTFNKTASVINKYNCYGDAYILHFDQFNNFYELDIDTFINAHNNMRDCTEKIQNITRMKRTKKTRCVIF